MLKPVLAALARARLGCPTELRAAPGAIYLMALQAKVTPNHYWAAPRSTYLSAFRPGWIALEGAGRLATMSRAANRVGFNDL